MDGAWLAAVVAFSVVSSVTPGPNNLLLWASGAEAGFGRTVPHVVGTALGLGLMALVILPTAALWAGAGGALARLVASPRARRAVNVVLAALLVGSVVTVWL